MSLIYMYVYINMTYIINGSQIAKKKKQVNQAHLGRPNVKSQISLKYSKIIILIRFDRNQTYDQNKCGLSRVQNFTICQDFRPQLSQM